jgi:hypothetical protein
MSVLSHSDKAVRSGNQELWGTSGAHRATPQDDFVYTVPEENPNVTEAREAFATREMERIAEVEKARKAIPATNVPPDFKAVVARLEILRRDERLLRLKQSQLQEEINRYQYEMEDLAGLGPFLQKRLKPELDQQKVSLGQRGEEIHAQLASLTNQIAVGESELHKIADSEFKKNWDLITKLLDSVRGIALKMDHNMIEAAGVGIQIRSHEARVVMFGEQYVAAATGYIIQPGAGEWLQQRKRGEFIGRCW